MHNGKYRQFFNYVRGSIPEIHNQLPYLSHLICYINFLAVSVYMFEMLFLSFFSYGTQSKVLQQLHY